ncbi:MAG: hypothetical protein ACE3JK_10600 [Sporolactobacillus sp.]
MDNSFNQQVKFRISGTELDKENGYNLLYLSESLRNFHSLVEKAYLTTSDGKRMSKDSRENLKIKAFNLRQGSFVADFVITMQNVTSSLLPSVAGMNPKDIWDLVVESYKYLKAIFEANKRGESLHVETVDSQNVAVVNQNSGTVIIVTPDVLANANASFPIFKKTSELITDNDEVKSITAVNNEKESNGITFGRREKILFQTQSIIEDATIEFDGKITKADGESFTGKIEVYENKSIEAGKYPFEYLVKKNPDRISDVFFKSGHFTALKVVTFDPTTLETQVVKLKIVDSQRIA